MSGGPENAAGPERRAMAAQPGAHLPPRHNWIPRATELEDRQRAALRRRPRIVSLDQPVACRDGGSIQLGASSLDELAELLGDVRTCGVSQPRHPAIALAGASKQPPRHRPARPPRQPHPSRPGMPHKAAGQNEALEWQRGRMARLPLGPKQRPRDLRREGFTQQPPRGEAALEQGGCHAPGVVGQLPLGPARVGELDETGASGQRRAERAEQSPVAVQPGQVNERGLPGVPMDPQLKTFCVRDGGSVRRGRWGMFRHGARFYATGPACFLAKMRLASSSVSFDPMSYQRPGTFQTWTGVRG